MSFDTDESIAIDLQIYIESNGQIYKRMTLPIIYNLQKKVDKKAYDPKKAMVMWERLALVGAKEYAREFKFDWKKTFPSNIRRMTAKLLQEGYDAHVKEAPEIRAPRRKNPSKNVRARRRNPEDTHHSSGKFFLVINSFRHDGRLGGVLTMTVVGNDEYKKIKSAHEKNGSVVLTFYSDSARQSYLDALSRVVSKRYTKRRRR